MCINVHRIKGTVKNIRVVKYSLIQGYASCCSGPGSIAVDSSHNKIHAANTDPTTVSGRTACARLLPRQKGLTDVSALVFSINILLLPQSIDHGSSSKVFV
ncbi:MAG: hypothetical protein WA667_25305 [Candidatus Nitrosopolaris sp.]